MLTPSRLKAVTGPDEAVGLFQELGFQGRPAPIDAAAIGLGDHPVNRVLKSASGSARGSAVFITEMSERPRSLKSLGRRLLQNFHDRPLGAVGVVGSDGRWSRFIVFRPNWIRGVLDAVRVAKLEVDVSAPTRHDAEVLTGLAWRGEDAEAQDRIDRALDVEAVTRSFYLKLAEHHERLLEAVRQAADADTAVSVGVKRAGGSERVALRILTQMLFCWFLQRMGLLAGDREYLRNRFLRKRGPYYATELEPLFYDTLAKPLAERPPHAPGAEIPFLNGGLFERHYGEVSLPLPDELFDVDEGLIGFLGGWTFTVAEDVPDEVEVAVDPEMLGKVFENLIGDEEARKQGTVYTPRPVVHFMCREALVPWLQDRLRLPEEWARRLLVDDGSIAAYAETFGAERAVDLAERLDHEIAQIRVLDPAVGSGAFLLGMLAEIVRLRRLARVAVRGSDPDPHEIAEWKRKAIEDSLFGVDINPTAIELCRLRLWLALVVDLPPGVTPQPLPNLEHRTIVADSLTDFVNGLEFQNTRDRQAGLGIDLLGLDIDTVKALRHAYFAATDPTQKSVIRQELAEHEDRLIQGMLERAREHGDHSPEALAQLDELRERFLSFDREFPIFCPGFHAPDVWLEGGWDVTIMNPPYLGRKEVAQHLDRMRLADYERHFGETNDLMILFARRARQLTKPGGVVSMIFNDSIFTSTDAERLRREFFDRGQVLVCARTRCFEGKAVNGGVVVQQLKAPDPPAPLRWVEGYKRPTTDFASASDPLPFRAEPGRVAMAGRMEVFSAPGELYRVLPHRPLFRPSAEAIGLLERFTAVERCDSIGTAEGWRRLSNTRALEREIEELERTGWYDRLRPGQWVLLGYVIEGGQGLATADDKHFLGAIAGTEAAADHLANQELLERLLEREPRLATAYSARTLPSCLALPAPCAPAPGRQAHADGLELRGSGARRRSKTTVSGTRTDDAWATAQVLLCLLRSARERGLRDLRALGCEPTEFPAVPWPPVGPSGRSLPRGSATALAGERPYPARLLERLSPIDTGGADLTAYLELVDRVLEDRRVTEDEAEALLACAEEWGLDRDDAERAHRRYLRALCEAALMDGRVTEAEREDLETVRRLFGLEEGALEEALAQAAPGARAQGPPLERLLGKTVCFTGTLMGRLGGEAISRKRAHRLAEAAGLVVRDRVTKALDILVVADPHTRPSKARAARRYGVRIMAEAAFWRAIGLQVE